MDTPIETSGLNVDDLRYEGKLVNSIGDERAKKLKARIDAELLRRRYYGSEYSIDNIDENYYHATDTVKPSWTFNEENSPKSGKSIQELQGRKIISPLLMICDVGDLMFTTTGENIPDDFQYERISNFLTTLENEKIDEAETSCRSACTGLCIGTCGSNCDGCTDQCTNMCKSSCGACSNGCSGCDTTCENHCEKHCQDSCGGQCNETCYNGCEGKCWHACVAACGGTCVEGCTGTCTAGPNKSSDPASCGGCYATCTEGCKTECTSTCGGNCINSSTTGIEIKEFTNDKIISGTYVDNSYGKQSNISAGSTSSNRTNKG